jgi:hypothetical protein
MQQVMISLVCANHEITAPTKEKLQLKPVSQGIIGSRFTSASESPVHFLITLFTR